MAEYIEREAAISAFLAGPSEARYPWWYVVLLKTLPAADIGRPTVSQFKRMAAQMDYAPVVHGRWMLEETEGVFRNWRCSRCGRGVNDNPEGIDLYCYHCGAKMDGNDGG